jgi:RAQPRD family integrative conjugative element protein
MTKMLKPLLLVATIAFSSAANASNFAERESLAKLVHELDGLSALVDEAQGRANPDNRIRFQYNQLRKDLMMMRLGIQEHLDGPTIEPRNYAPLSGDYRR